MSNIGIVALSRCFPSKRSHQPFSLTHPYPHPSTTLIRVLTAAASMASSLCNMHFAVAADSSSRKLCNAAVTSTSTSVLPQLRSSIRFRKPFFSGSDLSKLLSHSLKTLHTSTSIRQSAVQPSASANGTATTQGLSIDLRGKRAFIAGVADDQGYGWAIAKALAAAGAEILVGTWVPALNIFEMSLRRGKFDASRTLPNGSLMEIAKVYPLDAVFDNLDDVPEDIKANKRYAGHTKWTVEEVADSVKQDYGSIDILVHSLANGPEVTKPLLETSRRGYLAAISASSYSYVSLLKNFAPLMNAGGSCLSLTYIASEKIIPGYGGGMSSAKAALESDTRVLAFEAGRKHNIRVNTISAGPLRSRAAKAIGFIDDMINYSIANAPMQRDLEAEDVGNAAAFLSSPLAASITGSVVYVDNGLHAMGLATDSPALSQAVASPEKSNVAA